LPEVNNLPLFHNSTITEQLLANEMWSIDLIRIPELDMTITSFKSIRLNFYIGFVTITD
jgi:hypothetical protein